MHLHTLPSLEANLARSNRSPFPISCSLPYHEFPENVDEIGLISTGFNDLGLPPLLGRGIMPSDAPIGQDPQPVAVLSHRFWQKHFFGNPAVLGRTLQLNHKNYTIVGVAAPRFT